MEFVGEVDANEIPGLFSGSEYFISASEYEGFGVSAIEAMASGCVPVLSDIETFRGFVNGNNGVIVNFTDAEKAADKIMKLINLNKGDRKKMGLNAQNSVKKYSWGEKIPLYEKVYNGVLQ